MLKITRRVWDALWRLLKSTCISLSATPDRSPPLTIFVTPPLPAPNQCCNFHEYHLLLFSFSAMKIGRRSVWKTVFQSWNNFVIIPIFSTTFVPYWSPQRGIKTHLENICKEGQVEGNISKWPKIEHVSILHRNCMWLSFSLQLRMDHSKIYFYWHTKVVSLFHKHEGYW